MKIIRWAYKHSIKKPGKPTNLQKKYVHRTYDVIAQHFNHTRFAVWPRVKMFIDSLQEGSIMYDIGCGNGKYFNNHRHFMFGCDVSPRLLEYASRRNPNVDLMASDVLNLPIRSSSCDAFLCIAVLHHLSSNQTRIRALYELSRILKVKGRGLIYVWCLQQTIRHYETIPKEQIEPFHSDNQDILVKWHLQQRFSQEGLSSPQYERSYAKNAIIVKRYYHLYAKDELQTLIGGVPSLKIINSYYDKQNWCCEIEKK